jgi:hypothetical protein
MTRRLVALTVVGVLCGSPLLAYAGPPSPTWIPGFWDGADYDDIIVRITSTKSVAETGPVCRLEPHWIPIWSIPLADDPLTPFPAFASHQPRSPPVA